MTLADWIFTKREEARRLHLPAYREWIEAGARPLPAFGSLDCIELARAA